MTIDKIGSVTKNIPIQQEADVCPDFECTEGAIIAAEVMEDKQNYNQIELPTGRLSVLKKGDIVALALGNRRALKGFVGDVPKQLNVGDTIRVLNLGGVAGEVSSENVHHVGHAIPAKVLGGICKNGKGLNIKQNVVFKQADKITKKARLIIVSGTCMHVGKTSVAVEVISHASKEYHIAAAKLTGVACLKDTLKMTDYGAKEAVSFLDAGYTSSVKQTHDIIAITKGAINHLMKSNPDYIVIEFGDGIYGEYGVLALLSDPEIQDNIAAHIG